MLWGYPIFQNVFKFSEMKKVICANVCLLVLLHPTCLSSITEMCFLLAHKTHNKWPLENQVFLE